MNSHRQLGPIHIFRGTAEMVMTDRTDGVSHVRSTEVRLPIQFATRPSVSTTVYNSDVTCTQAVNDPDGRRQFSAELVLVIERVDVQTLGAETQLMIYAANPDSLLRSDTYFCDYIVIGDT